MGREIDLIFRVTFRQRTRDNTAWLDKQGLTRSQDEETAMSEDRRNDERVATNLPARWDGLSGAHEARVEDLSMGGCFINTAGRVDVGEIVVLEMKLPSGEWLQLRGEVTSYQPGIGFGLLFSFLTDEEEYTLRQLVI